MSRPPLPSNIGKRKRITDSDGNTRFVTVLDEVTQVHSNDPDKVIYLQKVQFAGDGRIELRLGYYFVGKKTGDAGMWVWGQFATMMLVPDFQAIVRRAAQKGWFEDAPAPRDEP